MATVDELGDKIRDYVNHPRLQHSLLQDLPRWNVLCSSLDVIGDTELAIAAYQHLDETEDNGVRYLVLYGILQVLFVQQDAAKHILESLNVDSPEGDADLRYVREIRNRAIGHPTKRDRSPQTSHFIARMSLHTGGFLLMSSDEHGTNESMDVPIHDLLQRQQAAISRMLDLVVKELREREEQHRMNFKDKKLAPIFQAPTVDYAIEKVREGCGGDRDRRVFAGLHVNLLMDAVGEFRSALTERGVLPAYSALKEDVEDAEYPLNELKKYFDSDETSTLNPKSSHIFAFFVKHQIKRLA